MDKLTYLDNRIRIPSIIINKETVCDLFDLGSELLKKKKK